MVIVVAGVPISLMTGNALYFVALGGMAGQAAWLLAIVVGCLCALLAYLGRLHVVVARTPMFLLFLLFAAMSLTWTPSFLDGVRMLAKLAAPIMFCWVLLAMRPDVAFARRIETALYAGCLISTLLAVVNLASGGALAPLVMKGGLGGMASLAAPFTSPANFSFFILVGAITAYCRFLQSRRAIHGAVVPPFHRHRGVCLRADLAGGRAHRHRRRAPGARAAGRDLCHYGGRGAGHRGAS